MSWVRTRANQRTSGRSLGKLRLPRACEAEHKTYSFQVCLLWDSRYASLAFLHPLPRDAKGIMPVGNDYNLKNSLIRTPFLQVITFTEHFLHILFIPQTFGPRKITTVADLHFSLDLFLFFTFSSFLIWDDAWRIMVGCRSCTDASIYLFMALTLKITVEHRSKFSR